jgi:ubiquitin C-terminal hydrolase
MNNSANTTNVVDTTTNVADTTTNVATCAIAIKYKGGLSGLFNKNGTSCYINSLIQTLSNTELITEYILNQTYIVNNKTNNKASLVNEWYKLLSGMWESNCKIQPTSFLNMLEKKIQSNYNFNIYEQNDVHEFLLHFIDQLTKEIGINLEININYDKNNLSDIDKLAILAIKNWESNFKNLYSYLHKILFSQYLSIIQCKNCNHKNYNFEPSLCIELELSHNNLLDCLNNFIKVEHLEDYKCDKCKKTNNVYKKLMFWKHSKILIIILKRFTYQGKINHYIDIPLHINFDKYCINYRNKPTNYSLYSIINHIGDINFGHYYSFTKSLHNNNWYAFNDENVQSIPENKIITNNAYCLFYILD